MFIRLGMTARTSEGSISRIQQQALDVQTNTARLQNPFLSYPDRRCETFNLYVSDRATGPWYLHSTWPATASLTHNAAYAFGNPERPWFIEPGRIDLTVNDAGQPFQDGAVLDEEDVARLNAELDAAPNRILVSDLNQPRSIQAKRTIYIGSNRNDRVVAMAATGLEVSEGQFGEYPVYVFSPTKITPLRVGAGDVAFLEGPAISITRGAVSRHAVTNVDGSIVYASREGVYFLNPGRPGQPAISAPLHVRQGADVLNILPRLNAYTALAYNNNPTLDVQELWVGTQNGDTYAYAIRFDQWFTMPRKRRLWVHNALEQGTLLYGLDAGGVLVEETARIDVEGLVDFGLGYAAVPFKVRSVWLHLGLPGIRKKLRRMRIYQPVPMDTLTWKVEYLPDRVNRGTLDPELLTDPSGLAGPDNLTVGSGTLDGQDLRNGRVLDAFAVRMAVRDFRLLLEGEGVPEQAIQQVKFTYQPSRTGRLDDTNKREPFRPTRP